MFFQKGGVLTNFDIYDFVTMTIQCVQWAKVPNILIIEISLQGYKLGVNIVWFY